MGWGEYLRELLEQLVSFVAYLAIKSGGVGFRIAKVGKLCGKCLVVHTFSLTPIIITRGVYVAWS